MPLDTITLVFAGGFVTILSGLFLLAYWAQNRAAWAAFWWGAANLGLGTGITLLSLRAVLPVAISTIVAPRLLDFCAILAFVAARVFNRGSVDRYRAAAGTVGWITLLILFSLSGWKEAADLFGLAGSIGLYGAAALIFWRGRGERLPGRMPMIGVLVAYTASLILLAVQFAVAGRVQPTAEPGGIGAIGLSAIDFVGLLYALGVTTFLIMMLAARKQEKYRSAALVDPLTGLANRAAFMDRAQRAFDRGGMDAGLVALLAFDLDQFKTINDNFGHAAGDEILRIFGGVVSSSLRSSSIVARIGGEEFVAVVPGASAEAAVAMARRVCASFQSAGQILDGRKIGATVSVGVATNGGRMCAVADVLAAADGALYRAKRAGRNRVVLAEDGPGEVPPDNVIRIA